MNGWKIYQGDKTGIEFKYPDDYIIRIQNHGWFFPVLESAHVITDDDKYIFEDDFLLSDVDDFISSDLVIGLDINRDGLVGFRSDVEKEFSEILSALTPTEGSSISEIKDITIDGKSGFEYEFKNVILNDDLGMFDISVMLVVDGDIRYRIFYFIFDDYSGDKTERINLYKDIISTLKLDAELARYDDIAFPLRDQAFDAQIKSELSQFRTYMAITY